MSVRDAFCEKPLFPERFEPPNGRIHVIRRLGQNHGPDGMKRKHRFMERELKILVEQPQGGLVAILHRDGVPHLVLWSGFYRYRSRSRGK